MLLLSAVYFGEHAVSKQDGDDADGKRQADVQERQGNVSFAAGFVPILSGRGRRGSRLLQELQ